MFKSNLLETNLCVRNRQVIGLYRLNYQRLTTLGLFQRVVLYRIPGDIVAVIVC
jgi:hypothetical protein